MFLNTSAYQNFLETQTHPDNLTSDNVNQFYENIGVPLAHQSAHQQHYYPPSEQNSYHSIEHVPNKPIPKEQSHGCNKCRKRFLSVQELNEHKSDVHPKRFTCSHCSKQLTCKLSLVEHIQRIHNNIRLKFPCHLCLKEYGSKQYLDTHIRDAHNRKFRCRECPNEYISETFLHLHIMRDHLKSDGRKFKCPSCPNEYATRKHLKNHMKEHALEFECPECTKEFSTKEFLQKHIEDCHTDVKNLTVEPKEIKKEIPDAKPPAEINTKPLKEPNNIPQTVACPQCSLKFRNDYFLQQHILNCHSQPNPNSPSDNKNDKCANVSPKKELANSRPSSFNADSNDEHENGTSENDSDSEVENGTTEKEENSSDSEETNSIKEENESTDDEDAKNTDSEEETLNVKEIFSCLQCPKKYRTKQFLETHATKFHESVIFQCKVCLKTFTYLWTYENHVKTHENDSANLGDKKFQCPECPKTFKFVYTLQYHVEAIHEGLVYECSTCSKAFGWPSAYKKHLLSKSHIRRETYAKEGKSSKLKKLHCPKCPKTFVFEDKLDAHMQSIHKDVYECAICQKSYDSPAAIKKHLRRHEENRKFPCSKCPQSFVCPSDVQAHIQAKHEGVVHECSICHKTFSWQSAYKRHLQLHEDKTNRNDDSTSKFKETVKDALSKLEKTPNEGAKSELEKTPKTPVRKSKYQCDKCDGKYFKSRRTLLHHLQSTHKGIKYKCSQCDKSFRKRQTRRQHVKAVHEGVIHQCDKCGKSFMKAETLRHHMQAVHAGVVVECPVCFKTFSWQRSLDRHMQSHDLGDTSGTAEGAKVGNSSRSNPGGASTSGAKPRKRKKHLCPQCPQIFADLQTLTYHVRAVHEGKFWECDLCPKKFSNPSGLNKHKLSRHEGRFFECDICAKTFSVPMSLRLHKQRVHWVMNQCTICGEQFLHPHLLVGHMQQTHPGVTVDPTALFEKPTFPCTTCGGRFSSLEEVKEHAKSHEIV